MNLIKKILLTLREIKKTSYHHYGKHPLSILKFLYISVLRINTFIVFENNFSRELPKYDFDPQFRVLKPTLEELDIIRKGKNLPREFYYDKIHKVRTCFLALCKDEIAYIHWVYFKGDYSRFLNIGDNVAEINYVTTLPKFRGKRLSAKMIAHTTKYLHGMGYKKIIMICHENNPPIIRSLDLVGFNEVCRIKALGPLNKKIVV